MEKTRSLLILYATETGNALDAAERLSREAERRGCPPRILSLDEFDPLDYTRAPYLMKNLYFLLCPQLDKGTPPIPRTTKAVQLIIAWGESEELIYLPVFRQTHLSLKANGIPTPRHGGNSSPMYQTVESLIQQQPVPPPDRFPLPDIDLMGIEDDTSPYTYNHLSIEQKKESLLVSTNSLDLLSSMLNSEIDPIPINDELTVSMLEKCKESLPVVQRIAETTTDDDVLVFEALNLHDGIDQIVSRCAEIKETVGPEVVKVDDVESPETIAEQKATNTEGTGSTSDVKKSKKKMKRGGS